MGSLSTKLYFILTKDELDVEETPVIENTSSNVSDSQDNDTQEGKE